jgi:hypothetical protein
VWGSVELADGAEHEDVVVELRCHSHAFHGSYIADREYRVVGAGDRFLFPWMLGGISPTGCTLNVYHPLYLFQYARSEPDFGHGAPSLRLETWEHLLARAEMGDDVSPVTEGDLNRHIFHMRHYYFNGLGGESERREAVRYVPALWRIYERGLELLPPMGHDRFGSMRSSFDYLRDIESELGYQRPSEQEALFAAAASGDLGAAVTALESGADIDAWNAHGAAAIHLAAREGHTELVIALIERGAISRAREKRHVTDALHNASRAGRVELVVALLDLGIPPDASWGTTGWTALMVAAFDGQPDTARLLIEAGADVNHRSQDGRTPLSMAHQRKSAPRRRGEVLALLKGAGARE